MVGPALSERAITCPAEGTQGKAAQASKATPSALSRVPRPRLMVSMEQFARLLTQHALPFQSAPES